MCATFARPFQLLGNHTQSTVDSQRALTSQLCYLKLATRTHLKMAKTHQRICTPESCAHTLDHFKNPNSSAFSSAAQTTAHLGIIALRYPGDISRAALDPLCEATGQEPWRTNRLHFLAGALATFKSIKPSDSASLIVHSDGKTRRDTFYKALLYHHQVEIQK